jgi:hypothetical protein
MRGVRIGSIAPRRVAPTGFRAESDRSPNTAPGSSVLSPPPRAAQVSGRGWHSPPGHPASGTPASGLDCRAGLPGWSL